MSLCSNVACKGVLGLSKSVVVSEGLVANRLEVVSPDESGIFTVPTGKPPHRGDRRPKSGKIPATSKESKKSNGQGQKPQIFLQTQYYTLIQEKNQIFFLAIADNVV